MRPMISLFALFCSAIATLIQLSAYAQSQQEHVYEVSYYRAHTGSENAYSKTWQDVIVPIFNELVSRGSIVSYLQLRKSVGDLTDSTHMILTEYPNWDAYANFSQAIEAASQEVFGRPWVQVRGDTFFTLREEVRNEIFMAPPPEGT